MPRTAPVRQQRALTELATSYAPPEIGDRAASGTFAERSGSTSCWAAPPFSRAPVRRTRRDIRRGGRPGAALSTRAYDRVTGLSRTSRRIVRNPYPAPKNPLIRAPARQGGAQ